MRHRCHRDDSQDENRCALLIGFFLETGHQQMHRRRRRHHHHHRRATASGNVADLYRCALSTHDQISRERQQNNTLSVQFYQMGHLRPC